MGCRTGTSMRRSTIWTADRPELAARDCSHARCRQTAEHHFGIRPRALYSIGPPHHPQVDAARRLRSVSVGLRKGIASSRRVSSGDNVSAASVAR